MDDNEARVDRAETAVTAYHKALGGWGSYAEDISDLLADLMHYVDSLTVDREIDGSFDDLLATAYMNYHAEKEGE